ncbi:putative monocarboxylic acid transporter [Leucosporidium creatinivorum]|uniref:Putative monocarboxylic acid transporter n=1 Tax=Leucosporidium creatinivorum TaxID=106004 RepID=A0A1Y2ESN6_9BASI|nr:putative monocarboxylic acid transporter [Leucosporidium creatinivorum]
MAAEAIELAELSAAPTRPSPASSIKSSSAFDEEGANAVSALPPVDGGKDAWLFLAAGTLCEALAWGAPFSAGVLHQYWLATLFPEGTAGRDLITLAVTLQTGLCYFACAFFGPLMRAYPQYRVPFQVIGIAGTVFGIMGPAFATEPWHVLVTFGLIYPLSGLYYLPSVTLLFEWFQARRGIASGIMFAGTGIGGVVFPFTVSALLNRFGYKAALISISIGMGILGVATLPFLRPRLPVPKNSVEMAAARKVDTAFLKRSTFYAFSGATLLVSFGNFIPSVWIPTYVTDLGMSEYDGTILLAVMNAASIPGLLILGHLSDIWPIRAVMTLSCSGSALACIFLWGFGKSIGMLSAFAVVFGLLGLSFSGIWAKLISTIAQDDPTLPTLIYSVFAVARGIGNITSGPVANALLTSNLFAGGKGAYGVPNYGALLLYSGLTMVAGSVAGVLFKTPRPQRLD